MSETDSTPLDVLLITVEEHYYIPRFLQDVVVADDIRIVGITTVPPSLGTQNVVSFAWDLYRRFGPRVFAQHVAFYSKYMILDRLNRITGRGPAYSPQTLAKRHGIEYRHVQDVNCAEYLDYVDTLAPDVVASVAATQKFEPSLIEKPDRCTINIHSSLLPQYRGVSPSFWNLLNDEERTGITVHYMDEDLDSGDIIRQSPLDIYPDDTLHTLNERVAAEGAQLLLSALRDIRTDSVDATPMNPEEGAYYSMPSRADVRTFLERGNKFF